MNTRRFPHAPASVGAARRFVAEALAGVDAAITDAVVLMVSELATNSVRHAASEFTVGIDRRTDEIRINVTDRGRGRPTLRAPAATDPSGRGLHIVQAFADSWGIIDASDDPGKTVWFSVSLRSRQPGVSAEAVERVIAEPSEAHEPSRIRRPRPTGGAGEAPRALVRRRTARAARAAGHYSRMA